MPAVSSAPHREIRRPPASRTVLAVRVHVSASTRARKAEDLPANADRRTRLGNPNASMRMCHPAIMAAACRYHVARYGGM